MLGSAGWSLGLKYRYHTALLELTRVFDTLDSLVFLEVMVLQSRSVGRHLKWLYQSGTPSLECARSTTRSPNRGKSDLQ